MLLYIFFFFFSSRRRHTRSDRDWSSDVCSSDLLDRRDDLEGKIASYRTMQEQRRQRLEWGRGAKEASPLMAELDLARLVLAKEGAGVMRPRGAVPAAGAKAVGAAAKPLSTPQAPRPQPDANA